MDNHNTSILEKINQSNFNHDQDQSDNEFSSSRISCSDQKRLFDFYDVKFGKQGLEGDHDDEIIDQPVAVQEQDKTKDDNGAQNDLLEIQNQLSTIQKDYSMHKNESSRSLHSKPLTRNFTFQNTNDLNSINSKVPTQQEHRVRSYLNDSSQCINLNQSKQLDHIVEEGNQKIEINSNLVKKNFKKREISQSQLQMHCANFIKLLKTRHVNRKLPQNFPFQFYQLINDKSCQQVYTKNKKLYLLEKEVKESMKSLKKQIPVFLPFNTFSLIWDSIFILVSSLFLFIYSILIFFAQNESSRNFLGLFQIATILFGIDILVSFNTAFFSKDQIITDTSKIAIKYLKTYFICDFLSFSILAKQLLLQEDFSFNPNNNVTTYIKNIIIFFKIFSLPKKRRNIQNSIIIRSYLKHLLKLFDQIFFVVLAAHVVSILWNGLSIIETSLDFDTNWQQKYQIEGNPWFSIYIFSLYWSVTTMTTIGYGDITPSNAVESLFVTVIMIFMSCVFAYSINNIGLILQEIEKDSKELNDKLSIIHKFMQMKGVNLELQRRVKHYLHFLSQESKDRSKQEEDIILQMLSNKLRDEVLKEINSKVVQQISCLVNNFSQKVIQELIFNIEEVLVQPNQIIFKEGELDEDQCMYFIWSGKIDIFYSDISKQKLSSSKTLTTLEKNQTFGEISFFSGFARSASARSVNLATLYKISRVKFLNILSHHLGDFEKFKTIEEQIKSQDNLSPIQIECYNCKQLGHLSVKCPLINAYFDKQLTILKNNYSQFQQRQKIQQISGQSKSQNIIHILRKRQKIHSKQFFVLINFIFKQNFLF